MICFYKIYTVINKIEIVRKVSLTRFHKTIIAIQKIIDTKQSASIM